MKAKTGPLAWLLYIVVRSAFAILQMFPIDWNLRTARMLAKVWIRVLPRHRRRAIEHVSASFGDEKTPGEIEEIADRCLESVAMFAVEVICMPRLTNPSTWSRHITLINFKQLLGLMCEGKGIIMVTGHYGSFELVGHLLAALQYDVTSVMRPLDNVYLNRFLVRTRRTHGLSLIDKKGAMKGAEAILRSGGLLGFIGDQDAGRKGVFVDFFDRPASTYKSIGLLAMQTGSPIVVGYARRCGNHARYDLGVERIIFKEEWEQRSDPLKWITQTYTAAIESFVRRAPEQYLWIHRRWKSKPRGRAEKRVASTSL